MPATDSTWMMFAEATLRERKMRSGTSGLLAIASRTRKPSSSTSEMPPSASVRAAPQPSKAAGLTIV
jgi:hypothetical protein